MSEHEQMRARDSLIRDQAQPSGLNAGDLFGGTDWKTISGSRGTQSEHLPPCHLMPIEEPRDGTPYHQRPVTPCDPAVTPPSNDSASLERNIPTPPIRPEVRSLDPNRTSADNDKPSPRREPGEEAQETRPIPDLEPRSEPPSCEPGPMIRDEDLNGPQGDLWRQLRIVSELQCLRILQNNQR